MNGISPYKAKLLAEQRIRWEPGLNDPSFGGWAATIGYFVAAAVTAQAARRAPARSLDRRAWTLICLYALLLGINKQLDLHILVIDLGRALAVDNGWYQQRRIIQRVFMAIALVVGAAVAIGGYVLMRDRDTSLKFALGGVTVTGVYALARAASFNHLDNVLETRLAGLRWDWTIELAGIALVAWAARRYRSRSA